MMRNQEMGKPLPGIFEENKPFWDYMKQHEFRVQKCLGCGKLFYPPSMMCPHCQYMESEWVKLSGKAKVYSFIIVRKARHPAFAKEAPYVVAIIETEEGIRYTTNIIGCKPEEVYVDMPVDIVYEDVNDKITLPKFKPVS